MHPGFFFLAASFGIQVLTPARSNSPSLFFPRGVFHPFTPTAHRLPPTRGTPFVSPACSSSSARCSRERARRLVQNPAASARTSASNCAMLACGFTTKAKTTGNGGYGVGIWVCTSTPGAASFSTARRKRGLAFRKPLEAGVFCCRHSSRSWHAVLNCMQERSCRGTLCTYDKTGRHDGSRYSDSRVYGYRDGRAVATLSAGQARRVYAKFMTGTRSIGGHWLRDTGG